MNAARVVYHLARADFLERVRRYSFLVMLLLVVFLGYQAAIGNVNVRLGNYRGEFNSAWVGSMMAIIASVFLGWFGFYLVKGSVARDRETGVGQIMATTPLTRPLYALGKWVSNFAVLLAMVLILAVVGVGIQLFAGESGELDLAALLVPSLFIALPMMALAAAIAVLFECVPFLQGGFGNILYFFLFIAFFPIADALTKTDPALEPLGFGLLQQSMGAATKAAFPAYDGGFVLGATNMPLLGVFHWAGMVWTPTIILQRFTFFGLAVVLTLAASIFFDRFDPSRRKPRQTKNAASSSDTSTSLSASLVPAAPSQALPAVHLTPLNAASNRFSFFDVFLAELKLLLKGQRWWWCAVALILVIAQFVNEPNIARVLLALAWTWPVLLLSGLGCRESRFDTRQIVFSAPRPLTRQLPAAWLSAFVVTALMGLGAFLRFLIAGESASLLAWTAGALFIPSLALALGVLTGNNKTFEVVYVSWMYLAIQGAVPFDFVGMTPESPWYVYAPLAMLLLGIAFVARQRQLMAKNISR